MFIDEFELEITENLFPHCKLRRDRLAEMIKKEFAGKKGIILLPGNFETAHDAFSQDSTFWYFTAISESGMVLAIDVETGKSMLFVPNHKAEKNNWNTQHITKDTKPELFCVDEVRVSGETMQELSVSPRFLKKDFRDLISYLKEGIKNEGTIFTVFPSFNTSYAIDLFLENVRRELGVGFQFSDIQKYVTRLRMVKDEQEIARLYQAIDVTITAHEAAISAMKHEISESEVAASAEFVLTANNCTRSFPTIVASGKNATTLHYHENKGVLQKGALLLVDMGARYDYYCADISRTYPVSGIFTKRQKELYEIVLEVQAQVAKAAEPGMFLNNKNMPKKSLQHLALSLFKSYNVDRYFLHGIGHHLGLDTHDTGDYTKSLEIGNVITIEPGLYIQEEYIGIRIEDNYLITESGAVCLSENLPKTTADIEQLIRSIRDEEADIF